MPLLPSASDAEPVLILTDEDYQRAFAPEEPPRAAFKPRPQRGKAIAPEHEIVADTPAFRNLPRPEPRSRVLPMLTAAAVLAVVVAGAVLAWLELTRAPLPDPVVIVAPGKPVAKEPEVQRREPAVAPEPSVPPPKAEPPPDPPPVEEAPRPVDVVPPSPTPPWSGGRAWVEVSLHMEYRGTVQDLRRKVVVVWDGSQFIVERPMAGSPEAWMQRLELLLQLSQAGDSWPRKISRVSKDAVACSGGTYSAERVEGEDRFPSETRRFVYWTAPEFGAGAIRALVTFPDVSVEFQVLAFGPEPGTARKP